MSIRSTNIELFAKGEDSAFSYENLILRLEPRNIKSVRKPHIFPWLIVICILIGLVASAAFLYLSGFWPNRNTVSASISTPQIFESTGNNYLHSSNTPIPVQVIPNPTPKLPSLTIGQPAPDFTLEDLNGKKLRLSDFRGQVVLINFWASWCQPCRLETPELVKAYKTYRDRKFMVLGVNLTDEDEMSDIEAFVKEFDMPYPVLLDTEGFVDELYGIPGIPMSIFIDREGKITQVQIGVLTGEQIEKSLDELLKS
ncbi:MAG: TlpA family protein disulfide reductase [Chloroflexi bacterium]|nr:TlpA family protein disulfide reductase [Chloroflexota bacterium]